MVVVQIVDSSGKLNESSQWFPEDEQLGAEAHQVVAVLGVQGSGKSTLLNSLFHTNFDVRPPRSAVGSATTKGITAAKSSNSSSIVVLDVEGADSRDRGRTGKVFASRCAAFATALCDALLVNIWFRDVARAVDSPGSVLLEAVLAETAKALKEESASKSVLMFVIRDVENISESVAQECLKTLVGSVENLWEKLKQDVPFEELFDVRVALLPHIRYQKELFDNQIANLNADLMSAMTIEMSKGIPADGFSVFAKTVWDTVSSAPVARISGANASSDSVLARADQAFSEALNVINSEVSRMMETVSRGDKIENFGSVAGELFNATIQSFQVEMSDCAGDPLVERKILQLSVAIDSALQSVFVKQLQLIRENSINRFKSAISSDEMPVDFAYYSGDALFARDAQASVRPDSDWSFESERADLQALLTDLVSQRKRIQQNRVDVAQAQASAVQVLQMQQAQMNAIQQQAMGGVSGQWNAQAMYRPPDTNVNMTVGYQPGRTTINLGMVPEEGASLLGANGFTAGFGPMNLGLNFNVNI